MTQAYNTREVIVLAYDITKVDKNFIVKDTIEKDDLFSTVLQLLRADAVYNVLKDVLK